MIRLPAGHVVRLVFGEDSVPDGVDRGFDIGLALCPGHAVARGPAAGEIDGESRATIFLDRINLLPANRQVGQAGDRRRIVVDGLGLLRGNQQSQGGGDGGVDHGEVPERRLTMRAGA